MRTVNKNVLEAEFKKHGCPGARLVEGDWRPMRCGDATSLIQDALAKALQAPVHPNALRTRPMEIVILPKVRRTRKRKINPTYAARQVIEVLDDTTLKSTHNQRKPKRGKMQKMKGLPYSAMVTATGQAGRGLEEWMHRQSAAPASTLDSGWSAIPQAEADTTRGDFENGA